MATSTNFGWTEPDDTDLVKNGAAAMRTLGNAIDSSLYNAVGKAAGKNAVINGGFDIWQRGTSITTSGAYTADRWGQVSGVSATFSRSTDVPSNQGFTYSMSMAGTGPNLNQRIESLNAAAFAGQTVTLSFWYKSTVGSDNLNIQLWYANSADNFASLTQIGSTQTISSPATSWTRYTYTYTNISANAINGLSLYIYRGNSATSTTLLTGVQLELGSSATPFSRAGGTIQGELAACQRYYEKSYDLTTNPASVTGNGAIGVVCGTNAANAYFTCFYPFKVSKRSAPTITLYDTAGTSGKITKVSAVDLSSTDGQTGTADRIGVNSFRIYANLTSCGGFYAHYVAEAEL